MIVGDEDGGRSSAWYCWIGYLMKMRAVRSTL